MSTSPELNDWLRLALVPGIGAERQRHLLAAFGLPTRIFSAGRFAIEQVIGSKLADQLLNFDSQAEIDTALAWANEPGNTILTLADAAYPQFLLQTNDPPSLIYVKGNSQLLNKPSIAMVGARNATPQGAANAEAFAKALAEGGMTVVSGMALGIDAAAHRGALHGKGSTIAVIGTGIDRIYPAKNAALAHSIAEKGAIISEFALGTPPVAHNFPRRNRIISGLSRGVLVVEAALNSGSLITARLAAEQSREVFAVPGSIHSPLSKGCHQLIKQGAKLVESAQDVMEELGWMTPELPGTLVAGSPTETGDLAHTTAHSETQRLLDALGFDPTDADTLLDRSRLTADALFAILTELELDGRIMRLPGNRFQRLN